MNKRYTYTLSLLLLFFCGLNGCVQETQQRQNAETTAIPKITATTGMIGDAVKNLVGDKMELTVLMGPGIDPHLYKPTQGDLETLSSADIIFYNGLFLEGKMESVLEKLAARKKVVAVGEGINKGKLIKTGHGEGEVNYDPHIWFDVQLWTEAVLAVNATLQDFDSDNAAFYQQNFEKYYGELQELDEWVGGQILTIPQKQRVLITSHDAFGYFGRAYQIEVEALQGISTASDYGLKDVSRILNLIVDRNIKSVFIESSVSGKSLQAVVEGCHERGSKVNIGGTLFSDAMGENGTPEGTYIGMVRHNVNAIVNALK